MRTSKILVTGIFSILILGTLAQAQTQGSTAEPANQMVPIKVQVVFKEYQGSKEISSLPYTVPAVASSRLPQRSELRMGLRVPYAPRPGELGPTTQVGTRIDCEATVLGDGLFTIHLVLSRNSIYPSGGAARENNDNSSSQAVVTMPVFDDFSTSVELLMRNGQTTESTMSTDPVSGRVLRVYVTLHVMK